MVGSTRDRLFTVPPVGPRGAWAPEILRFRDWENSSESPASFTSWALPALPRGRKASDGRRVGRGRKQTRGEEAWNEVKLGKVD